MVVVVVVGFGCIAALGCEELAGITKAVYDAKHLGTTKQSVLHLEVMRHVIRTKGEEKCVGFLDVAKQLFDVALANYYSAKKKKGGRFAQLAPDEHGHHLALHGPR